VGREYVDFMYVDAYEAAIKIKAKKLKQIIAADIMLKCNMSSAVR